MLVWFTCGGDGDHSWKDLHGNNGDGEAGGLQLASGAQAGEMGPAVAASVGGFAVGGAVAKGGADVAGARVGAVAVSYGDVDEGGDEGDIEDDSDEGGERSAGEAAKQQQAGKGVEGRGARDALNGADRGGDREGVVVQGRQEVGENGENEDGAAELDAADKPLQEFQGEAHDYGRSMKGEVLWCQACLVDSSLVGCWFERDMNGRLLLIGGRSGYRAR